jgi:hypothetical protein
MEKLLGHVVDEINGKDGSGKISINVEDLLKDQNIHEYLSDILFAAHKQERETKNDNISKD